MGSELPPNVDADEVSPARARRRWVLVAVGLAILVVLVTVGGVLVGRGLKSPAQLAAEAQAPGASLVTARAELRVITEPIVARGTVVAGGSVKLAPPAGAAGDSSVVTSVKVKVGDRANEGRVLLELSGRPVIGLVLPFPLYRDINPGDKGPDVREVQRALRRLGYWVTVTETFDSATQKAVKKFLSARGYEAPTASATGGSGSTGSGSTGATPGPTAGSTTTAPSVQLPRSMVARLTKNNQKVTAVRVARGAVLTDPKAVLLEFDGAAATVRVVADRDQAGVLKVGQQADIADDTTGASTTATVKSIGTKPVTSSGGTSGFEVRLTFTGDPLPVSDRSLRVSIAPGGSGAKVLAVPVSAVYSRADGSTFVTVAVDKDHTQDVTVTVGDAAGGWVEVDPHGNDLLKPDAAVVVGKAEGSAGATAGAEGFTGSG
jgi:peptidoglycan hydrolase-like protein with peptidoglycan-binding domain